MSSVLSPSIHAQQQQSPETPDSGFSRSMSVVSCVFHDACGCDVMNAEVQCVHCVVVMKSSTKSLPGSSLSPLTIFDSIQISLWLSMIRFHYQCC